jgi:hypothetical protein
VQTGVVLSIARIPSALKISTLASPASRLLNHDCGTVFLFSFLQSGFRNRTELALENLALRQQLAILKRERPHARLRLRDRLFWEYLSSVSPRWRESLIVVKPETVVRWHRKAFALYWTHLSKHCGSGRRDCLNHVMILGESHLRKILARYFDYYHKYRTHLSLDKDAPERRPIQDAKLGEVIEIPEVGGLHHHYERRAA